MADTQGIILPDTQSKILTIKLLAWAEAYGIALPQDIYNLCQEILNPPKPLKIHYTGGLSDSHTETSE